MAPADNQTLPAQAGRNGSETETAYRWDGGREVPALVLHPRGIGPSAPLCSGVASRGLVVKRAWGRFRAGIGATAVALSRRAVSCLA